MGGIDRSLECDDDRKSGLRGRGRGRVFFLFFAHSLAPLLLPTRLSTGTALTPSLALLPTQGSGPEEPFLLPPRTGLSARKRR